MNILWITTEAKISQDTCYVAELDGISADLVTEPDDALALLKSKEFDAAVVNAPLGSAKTETSKGGTMEFLAVFSISIACLVSFKAMTLLVYTISRNLSNVW